jgi:Glycosyltransferase family 9 (heptosyltransferase)
MAVALEASIPGAERVCSAALGRIGDAIQFVRYLPLVIARGGKVIFACQPALHRLFANVAGIDRIIGMDDPLPNYDLHCPLLSLPLIFTTTIESIPAAVPYLAAAPESVQRWARRIPDVKQRRIGIAWAGAAGNSNDRNRSMSPEFLSPLADVAGVQLVSLQKSPTPPPSASLKMIDHTSELNDFADTAALIANLDLVISVDTAVAHLAGAMGKPAWLLLTHLADWRWHLDRKDSPWYPTMRLFRQKSAGDWGDLMQRVATALNALPPRT